MSTDSVYVVELKGLTFKRGSRAIFDNIDVRIPRGKVADIMGPSGCDKTTLLRLVIPQLRPSKGEVWVNGQNLPQFSCDDLFDIRKQFDMLFQSGALLIDLNIFESVAFPLRVHTRLPGGMVRDIVLTKPRAVGLRGVVELMPDELSDGMKRRVALARATALNPQILLCNEPFMGQDPVAVDILVRLIRLLNGALGATNIVVSRDLAEAASTADHIYIVGDGRVLGHRTLDVLKRTDDPRIRQFVEEVLGDPVPFHYPARDYRADLPGKRRRVELLSSSVSACLAAPA